MKGVILGGGLGSRLYPLTHATNKHLLPIYHRPMVFYPISTLVSAGIDEVIIVTGGLHAGDYLRVLQNGRHLGLRHLEYTYQDRESGIVDESLYRSNVFWAEKALGGSVAPSVPAQETVTQH